MKLRDTQLKVAPIGPLGPPWVPCDVWSIAFIWTVAIYWELYPKNEKQRKNHLDEQNKYQPRSQGLSTGREEERPWERGWTNIKERKYFSVALICFSAWDFIYVFFLGKWSNYHTRTGPTKPQNRWWCLRAPPLLNVKRWCLYCTATPLSSSKKLQWDSNLTFLVCLVMLTLASWIFLCQLKLEANKILSVMFMR